MIHAPYRILLTALTLLLFASGCRKEADPRPMADLNLLKGRWSSTGNAGPDNSVMEFDPATRSSTWIQMTTNQVGFKVGDPNLRNVEAVDERTWRGELMYRSASGYRYFADVRLKLENNELVYTSDAGVTTGNLTVSGQTGKWRRVR
jgi:hypothetical protein